MDAGNHNQTGIEDLQSATSTEKHSSAELAHQVPIASESGTVRSHELEPGEDQLFSGQPVTPDETGQRPGCVTTYVVLMAFGVTGAISWIVLSMAQGNPDTSLVLYFLVFSVVNMAVIVGLWRMRNWARVLTIIMLGIGFFGYLLQLFGIVGTRPSSEFILSPVVDLASLAIDVYAMWWFYKNRQRFV